MEECGTILKMVVIGLLIGCLFIAVRESLGLKT